jgi:hypothetical protein
MPKVLGVVSRDDVKEAYELNFDNWPFICAKVGDFAVAHLKAFFYSVDESGNLISRSEEREGHDRIGIMSVDEDIFYTQGSLLVFDEECVIDEEDGLEKTVPVLHILSPKAAGQEIIIVATNEFHHTV